MIRDKKKDYEDYVEFAKKLGLNIFTYEEFISFKPVRKRGRY